MGNGAHCVVSWKSYFVVLDSNNGNVNLVDIGTGKVTIAWANDNTAGKVFLKGMVIIEDVAYIGVSPATSRQFRTDKTLQASIAALDLNTKKILWKKTIPSHGLVNLVAAPHLAVSSTYKAIDSWAIDPKHADPYLVAKHAGPYLVAGRPRKGRKHADKPLRDTGGVHADRHGREDRPPGREGGAPGREAKEPYSYEEDHTKKANNDKRGVDSYTDKNAVLDHEAEVEREMARKREDSEQRELVTHTLTWVAHPMFCMVLNI